MNEPDKENKKAYLGVYVTCRRKWVAVLWRQSKPYQVWDLVARVDNAFVVLCDFGPNGVSIRVDPELTIVLVGRVELWVKSSGPSDPVAGVVLGATADLVNKGFGDENGSGKRANPRLKQ